MLIAHMIDRLDASGGAENALAALAAQWVKDGHETHIFVLKGSGGLQVPLQDLGVTVTAVPGGRQRLREASRLVGALRPDVLHTSLFEADLLGRRTARRLGVPCVSSIVATGYGADHYGDPRLTWWRVAGAHALDAATGLSVDRFHAVSHHAARTMSRRLLIPAGKITVIPRGKDPMVLGSAGDTRRREVRQRLRQSNEAPLLLAAARHEQVKGLDLLLGAMPTILQSSPEARLVVAGREGAATPMLQQLISNLGLGHAVTLLGRRDDVPDLIAAADLVVVPSRREGISNVAIEAMCIGTPIVASDVPAVRETVGGDAHADLVVPTSEGIAGAVLARLQSGGTKTAVARAYFDAHYNIDSVARQMVDLYRSVRT